MNDKDIAQMYLSGKTIGSIVQAAGSSRYKITRALDREGVERRKTDGARIPVRLTADEIPEEHRESFDFDHQYVEGIGPERRGLVIVRKCSHCTNTYTVPVSQVRGDLGRNRKMRAGKCSDCRGRIINSDGYVWINVPEHPNAYSGKYVPEHILVMESSLGRYIDTKAESVHHINGDRSDNALSNLQLRRAFHGKGAAFECLDCGSHNVAAVALKD